MGTTTFITFTAENVNAIIGYMSSLLSNFLPLILLVIGVALAIWFLEFILKRR